MTRNTRKPMEFTDIRSLAILQAIVKGGDLPYSKPVIDRFIETSGLVKKVAKERQPGQRGRVSYILKLTREGSTLLNLRAGGIQKKRIAALTAQADELEKAAAELRRRAEEMFSKAAALRGEIEEKPVDSNVEPETPSEEVSENQETENVTTLENV